jgi:hypothetical protein
MTHLQFEQHRFPTVFRMTKDYLPIQPSAVPCEHVFSSSAETDTKKWNRINPMLMEALQMLKFSLKQDRLGFRGCWVSSEKELGSNEEDVEGEGDALSHLVEAGSNVDEAMVQAIGRIAIAKGTM